MLHIGVTNEKITGVTFMGSGRIILLRMPFETVQEHLLFLTPATLRNMAMWRWYSEIKFEFALQAFFISMK